jgi:hypothetical protein
MSFWEPILMTQAQRFRPGCSPWSRITPVTEVVPLDQVPDGFDTAWHWEAANIPHAVFNMMLQLYPHLHNDDRHGRWCGRFSTYEAAVSALARTLAQLARGKAGVA